MSSNIFTCKVWWSQESSQCNFSKVGLAEIGIDEVSIQHLKTKLKISAIIACRYGCQNTKVKEEER
eukprot:2329880-Amphidinium_carterae.2